MFVREGNFYFHHCRGGGRGGNDHYIITSKPRVKVDTLRGVEGVRMLVDDEGEERLKAFLTTQINRRVAEMLDISSPTVSRIRKAIGLPNMGLGGDRKSHKYYRMTYDEPAEQIANESKD